MILSLPPSNCLQSRDNRERLMHNYETTSLVSDLSGPPPASMCRCWRKSEIGFSSVSGQMMRSIIPQCNKQLVCDNEITVIIPSSSSSLTGVNKAVVFCNYESTCIVQLCSWWLWFLMDLFLSFNLFPSFWHVKGRKNSTCVAVQKWNSLWCTSIILHGEWNCRHKKFFCGCFF